MKKDPTIAASTAAGPPGVVSDVSDLSDAARRAPELVETAPVGIYACRPDGTLLSCNPAFVQMFGFRSAADAIGSNVSVVHTAANSRERFVQHVRDERRIELCRGPMRRLDGTAIEVMTTAAGVFDAAGTLTEVRAFVFDITGNGEADAALVGRGRGFRSVFVDAADPMLLMDDDRRIVDANRGACALFALAKGALTARALDDLLPADAARLDVLWRELLALGEAKYEHRVGAEGRGVRLIECTYRASVEPHRHLCIARDVTDRRVLEERLVQSEKMESVGRLAGGIAHDFNNLLTAILGYSELLLDACGPEDPARADLKEIHKAGQRAATLTRQLLAYSRKQVLLPKEVDLNQTVSDLQGMLKRLIREDITLTFELAPAPAMVGIDPAQLEQVIVNLVLNARDALPIGGLIRLEVARLPASEVDVPPDRPVDAAEFVRLRVIDNGVGIAPEVRAHLFEPFFTTKAIGKGTGLGLASAHGIVHQSNGFISVASEPGLGATFSMYFPAVAEASQAFTAPAGGLASSGGRGTILLVEDEDAVRQVVATVLRRQGYSVLAASTPGAACELFEQHAGTIDLLLTDIIMPEMNGPALAQRLVAARPELRVLFISGYADSASPFDAGNPNLSFLSKPFHASALAAKVREALSRPRPSVPGNAKE